MGTWRCFGGIRDAVVERFRIEVFSANGCDIIMIHPRDCGERTFAAKSVLKSTTHIRDL